MFDQWKTRRKIRHVKEEILEVERRMHRSHSACMEALLQGKQMPEEEVRYHKKYMDQIDALRHELRDLESHLKKK